MSVSIWAVTAVSVASFVAIGLVSKKHFVSKGPLPPFGTIVIVAATLASFATFLWSISIAPRDTLAPILFYLAAMTLFLRTVRATRNKGFLPAFANVVPDSLTVEGPYRSVRHPFYVSYLLYHLGNAVATATWMPWAALATMLIVYVCAARNEERYLARGSYSAAYAAYKQRTGMFFPRLLTKSPSSVTHRG